MAPNIQQLVQPEGHALSAGTRTPVTAEPCTGALIGAVATVTTCGHRPW